MLVFAGQYFVQALVWSGSSEQYGLSDLNFHSSLDLSCNSPIHNILQMK